MALLGATNASAGDNHPPIQAEYGKGSLSLHVATGSPGALGLLKALAEPFCSENDCNIKWSKLGSGASLKALKAQQVDLVMVHAPKAEQKAVTEGWATHRTLFGSNEFYILGPKSDPAGIKQATSAHAAYQKIAQTGATFFSRADNSGTHKKEMMIWRKAKITPQGDWYIKTHTFMTPSLLRADKEQAYFMSDSSTYYANKAKLHNLAILYRGDPILINVYHALSMRQQAKTNQKSKVAKRFIDYLASRRGQKILDEYGKKEFGTALYSNAQYAKKWNH